MVFRAMTSEDRRNKSLQKAEMVGSNHAQSKTSSPPPLFALPGSNHVADEGSCALAAEQLPSELLSKLESSSKEERATALWSELQSM